IENRTGFGEASGTARLGGDLGLEGFGGMSFDEAVAAEGSVVKLWMFHGLGYRDRAFGMKEEEQRCL
ncbi:hypothetical protein A2U01_0074078, partial [Trifolium medium]|nr:hypothetical protein [Trifolium medium]